MSVSYILVMFSRTERTEVQLFTREQAGYRPSRPAESAHAAQRQINADGLAPL